MQIHIQVQVGGREFAARDVITRRDVHLVALHEVDATSGAEGVGDGAGVPREFRRPLTRQVQVVIEAEVPWGGGVGRRLEARADRTSHALQAHQASALRREVGVDDASRQRIPGVGRMRGVHVDVDPVEEVGKRTRLEI